MNIKVLLILCCFSTTAFSQSITNGNFSSNSSGWGCSPETNPESVYGGSGTNRVAEIDASAGRCQTVTGFTVGHIYTLSFQVSRRTNCGPTLQSMSVTVDGNALNTTVSRNGTSFSLANESFTFTAASTSHVITFAGTTAGTCGLLLDNVQIAFTALPVELTSFSGETRNHMNNLEWSTASEIDNKEFSIERSNDGEEWTSIGTVMGAGNSNTQLNYKYVDQSPKHGANYYRLKQLDYNGDYEYSMIIKLKNKSNSSYTIGQSPDHSKLIIFGTTDLTAESLALYDQMGRNVVNEVIYNSSNQSLDISSLSTGVYIIVIDEQVIKFMK